MSRIVFLLAAGVLLASCRDFSGPETATDIVGTEWTLYKFEQPDGLRRDIGSINITLKFEDDGSVSGSAFLRSGAQDTWEGFNYGTVYELPGSNVISIGVPVPDRPIFYWPLNNRWGEYERAVHLSDSYRIDANELHLLYDDGWALVFEKHERPDV